jgi:tetratricopeptide (TPR) repeat protein
LVIALWATAATGQDSVHVANPASPRGYAEWKGRVEDYTGRELVLRLTSGLPRTFPADQVLRIDTQYGPQKVEADRQFDHGEFDSALALYARARDSEPRKWVRRQITAQMVWCYRALGQWENAGREFLDVLLADDPSTPYFDAIPLAWVRQEPSLTLERTAQQWLDRDKRPAAALVGASHLLSTPHYSRALARLRHLAAEADPRIAYLALAQTWRAAAVTAKAEQLAQWRATIERMPEPLRPGPYYVLGAARAQHRQWEQAALAWMRVPILYPKHRTLAAQALLDAGRALERLGRPEQSVQLYGELEKTYPNNPAGTEAERRLEEMKGD